jgi:hypothetical protein
MPARLHQCYSSFVQLPGVWHSADSHRRGFPGKMKWFKSKDSAFRDRGPRSDFQKNAPAIEKPHRGPANQHEGCRVQQRGVRRICIGTEAAFVEELLPGHNSCSREGELQAVENIGHDGGANIGGDSVHSEHQEWSRPPSSPLLDIRNPIAKSQTN